MLKKITVVLMLLLVSLLSAQELKQGTDKLTTGAKAFQADDMETAKADFNEAMGVFSALLEGIQTPVEEAYSRYYLAMARYYVSVIDKNMEGFQQASTEYQEAINAFRNIEVMDQDYVSSLFYKGMCSFRQYQIASGENSQANLLNSSIGDFQTYLTDEIVLANVEEYAEQIATANFYIGYSQLMFAEIKMYNPSTYDQALRALNDAPSYFQKAQEAMDERLAITARLYEAETNYLKGRVYAQVDPDAWDKTGLSDMERNAAIQGAVEAAISLDEKMISSAGAHKDLQTYGDFSQYGNDMMIASLGERQTLTDILTVLAKKNSSGDWGKEVSLRIAHAQLINYFNFGGNIKAVYGALGGTSGYNETQYWSGWLDYINGDYDKAKGKFSQYGLAAMADRSRRGAILRADAKFRKAECSFWSGVKTSNISTLNEAKADYKALSRPEGEYFKYLSSDVQKIVQVRLSLIDIEQNLAGSSSKEELFYVLQYAGFSLPDDADEYLNIGKYFLEKGIKTAEKDREQALNFARYAFDAVIDNGAVSATIKNQAKFMKGVGMVKFATILEGGEQTKMLDDARAVLGSLTAPFSSEGQYVIGITYFIANDYATAQSKFTTLANQGHLRAAFYLGVTTSDDQCAKKGGVFAKIMKSVKDKNDPTYQNADIEYQKLRCKGSVTPQTPYSSILPDPPMTYENLVDQKADELAKKNEALVIWQKVSFGKTYIDIDEIISDKPPETNVSVTILISPSGGEEEVIIDGDPELVESEGESKYKVTLTRGKHDIVVKKKGYYLLEELGRNIVKTETIELNLNKAVRYTKGTPLAPTDSPMSIAGSGDDLFVANNGSKEVLHIGSDGGVKDRVSYEDLGVVTVTAIAVDGEVFVVADSKHNMVVMSSFDGDDINVVAHGNEPYGDKKLNNPSAIAASDGTYYIVDSSNKRVLYFEGASYRTSFGSDVLKKPVGIELGEEGLVYVTDIIDQSVVVFNSAREKEEAIKLDSQSTPSYIYKDSDGFFYIADYVNNTIGKYTGELELLTIASTDVASPRGLTLLGLGPDATMYVASKDKVSVLKGGWDNVYMP